MPQKLAYVAVVVRDYDEALAYFINVLGFELIEDTPLDSEKRWVLIAPPGSQGTRLLLARAATPEQASRVGNQTGGRVFLFLHTDDFWRDYHAMKERGVNFKEAPREKPYATVAIFEDIYGNRWDLLQLNSSGRKSSVENGTKAKNRAE
jgi:catechol 2,3-dioxygenase-like lactoylglutathione lyase family enzyme